MVLKQTQLIPFLQTYSYHFITVFQRADLEFGKLVQKALRNGQIFLELPFETLSFEFISVMLNDNPMIEGTSGEVRITDFTADVIENLLFFMYNDTVDKKSINCHLLKAANKYLMDGLKNICSEYLSANLNLENALELMVAAYLTGW